MSAPLKAAVVGAGRMGMVHGHLLQVHPDTELVGFVDRDTSLRDSLASQGLRAPLFESQDALYAATAPDAVFVCTPTHTHLPVVRDYLKRPVHLFVEKPLATSRADAEAIEKLADQAGVMHAAGYVYAHLPIVAAARELLAAGVLGELLRFHAHAYVSEVFSAKQGWFFQKELAGGGVVANMGSHLMFILGWFFGPIRRVTGCFSERTWPLQHEQVIVDDQRSQDQLARRAGLLHPPHIGVHSSGDGLPRLRRRSHRPPRHSRLSRGDG